MDEESILNFWISQEKPKDLPEGWIWTDDMLNISVIFDAYKILHPDDCLFIAFIIFVLHGR